MALYPSSYVFAHVALRGHYPRAKMRRTSSRVLKKSLVSPAQPRRAETRLFPGNSLIVQTFNLVEGLLGGRRQWRNLSVRQNPWQRAHGLHEVGMYLLSLLRAAAFLNSLFEHPARELSCGVTFIDVLERQHGFPIANEDTKTK